MTELARQTRYKTLSVAFHSVTVTYLISNKGSFYQYVICLLVGFAIQASANLFNSLQVTNDIKIKKATAVCFTLSVLAGSLAVIEKPFLIFFGLLALAISAGYSKKLSVLQVRPSETVLADLFILFSFGPIGTYGSFYFFGGTNFDEAVTLSVINGVFAHNLLWIHRIKDIEKDKASGKKTLAVRLGFGGSVLVFVLENLFAISLGISTFGYLKCFLAVSSMVALAFLLCQKKFFESFHLWVLFLLLNPFFMAYLP
ncbi:MAG: prenyltransferase [Deltaproteobacteria bacterium]|nr:prenyltransferase [Deltaproteobacteria bacterium]MCX7953443.1 prenyltransferase [Deltaproteobacteria bacterium]